MKDINIKFIKECDETLRFHLKDKLRKSTEPLFFYLNENTHTFISIDINENLFYMHMIEWKIIHETSIN